MREGAGHALGRFSRVVRTVLVTVRDGAEGLPKVSDDTDTEKLQWSV